MRNARIIAGFYDTRLIFGKFCAIAGGRFLYSFKDAKRAAAEEAGYLANAEKKHNFDHAGYERKRETFGVIVFESDQDLPPKIFDGKSVALLRRQVQYGL